MQFKTFPSKVLLFGEYSVIKHSNALAMSYPLFDGRLMFKSTRSGQDPELKALCKYLHTVEVRGELPFDIDLASFEFDIGQGLVFESTIPQGYGVGSSGALCAAVYDRYAKSPDVWNSSIEVLRHHLCLIESHFHGSSSGLDPLVSYLGKPILKTRDVGFRVAHLPTNISQEGSLFLLNTGRSRKTEPLVNLFLEKCNNPKFSLLCENELTPLTDACISSYLEGHFEELWHSFGQLSSFQYTHLKPMIPNLYRDLWKLGLKENNFYLKLCGAGGGGFLMGITKDFKSCSRHLKDFEIRPL